MRVVICWAGMSGYMAACWRALAAMPGLDLLVVVPDPGGALDSDFKAGPLVRGYGARVVSAAEYADPEAIARIVVAHKPDVVVLSGWAIPSFVRLPSHPDLQRCRFVMTMDTPWKGTLRQRLGRFRYASYFRRMERVIVAGERSYVLARVLGFNESQIRRGGYGFDYDTMAPVYARRVARGWPRRFLFVARYVEAKGIDTMLDAFRRYRTGVPDPWTLAACGQGPLKGLIHAAAGDGVTDLGFVQPADLPEVFLDSGAFVLASRYEPWGVVIGEAGASGLPLLCTEACSSSIDLVRSHYNGMVVPTGDAEALARAMRWVHDRYDRLPEIGARSMPYAAAFSAQVWAERWAEVLRELGGPTP
jgi:glycosyltransferase involved in cell wall biosynthesis